MPQLDFAHYPFFSQLLWLFISFGVLYFYSARVILPRISNVLETRDETIKNALLEAERIKNEASNYFDNNDKVIAEARAEANRIIGEAEAKANEKAKDEYKKIDAKVAERIKNAESNILKFTKAETKEVSKLSDEIFDNLVKKYIS